MANFPSELESGRMAGSLFCGRSPAHEAETVREQHHTYNHSTRSGPQRGTSQLILIGRSSEFEGKSIVRAWTE
jgi:hypothetical protein